MKCLNIAKCQTHLTAKVTSFTLFLIIILLVNNKLYRHRLAEYEISNQQKKQYK